MKRDTRERDEEREREREREGERGREREGGRERGREREEKQVRARASRERQHAARGAAIRNKATTPAGGPVPGGSHPGRPRKRRRRSRRVGLHWAATCRAALRRVRARPTGAAGGRTGGGDRTCRQHASKPHRSASACVHGHARSAASCAAYASRSWSRSLQRHRTEEYGATRPAHVRASDAQRGEALRQRSAV